MENKSKEILMNQKEVGNSQELFWKLCSVKSPEKFETLTEKKMDDVDVGCFSL